MVAPYDGAERCYNSLSGAAKGWEGSCLRVTLLTKTSIIFHLHQGIFSAFAFVLRFCIFRRMPPHFQVKKQDLLYLRSNVNSKVFLIDSRRFVH